MEKKSGNPQFDRSGVVEIVVILTRQLWPLVVTGCGFVFWISGRLESPEEQVERIQHFIKPLEVVSENNKRAIDRTQVWLEQHGDRDGHQVIVQRVHDLERRIVELEKRAGM